MPDKSIFMTPGPEFRPTPFWFWNADLREDELLAQLDMMQAMGCGGAFIHARFGLEGEYLGSEWFRLIRSCCERAAALGMHLWLYDENPFPSGIGGLRVTAEPGFRAKYLEAVDFRHASEVTGTPLAMGPVVNGGIRAVYRRVLQATNGKAFGPDYLNPDAMRFFMEVTHTTYERNLGDYLGTVIKGFFTDEPTLLPWHHDLDWYGRLANRRVAPWGDLLPGILESRGLGPGELGECLLALFATEPSDGSEPDDKGRRGHYRRLYWDCVAGLYDLSFSEPYARWCRDRGLFLTGHLLLEEGLYTNTLFQGHPARILGRFDMPGTDHLGADREYPYGGFSGLPQALTNVQGQKLVSSVAHTRGRNRVLSETFGCAGWGLDMRAAKRVLDWQLCLGINFFCPHAFFQSIEGFRKTDAPPCFLHNVSSREFRSFADHVARASYLMSQGEHVAGIALWYPLQGFQSEYSPGTIGPEAAVATAYDTLCTALTHMRYGYDIIDAGVLDDAYVDGGLLRVGLCSYAALIVPETQWVPDELERIMREFEGEGGLVLRMSGDVPDLGSLLSVIPPVLELQPPDPRVLAVARRDPESGDYTVFVTNTSGDTFEGRVAVPHYTEVDGWCASLWDTETGAVSGLQWQPEGTLALCLPPDGSACLVMSRGAVEAIPASIPTEAWVDLPAPAMWEMEPMDHNVLPLDKWDLSLRNANGWESYIYATTVTFAGDGVPENLLLSFEDIEYRDAFMGSMDLSVEVGGRWVEGLLVPSTTDPRLRLLDVSGFFVLGPNSIRVTIRHSAWSGQPRTLTTAPRLLGGFVVKGVEDGSKRDQSPYPVLALPTRAPVGTGSWTLQGYPYYSGTMKYSAIFDIRRQLASLFPDPGDLELCLCIDGDVGSSFRVMVDGVTVGTRAWPPWRVSFPLTIAMGERPVELTLEVTNTSANVFEAVARESGLMGNVGLRARRPDRH